MPVNITPVQQFNRDAELETPCVGLSDAPPLEQNDREKREMQAGRCFGVHQKNVNNMGFNKLQT